MVRRSGLDNRDGDRADPVGQIRTALAKYCTRRIRPERALNFSVIEIYSGVQGSHAFLHLLEKPSVVVRHPRVVLGRRVISHGRDVYKRKNRTAVGLSKLQAGSAD